MAWRSAESPVQVPVCLDTNACDVVVNEQRGHWNMMGVDPFMMSSRPRGKNGRRSCWSTRYCVKNRERDKRRSVASGGDISLGVSFWGGVGGRVLLLREIGGWLVGAGARWMEPPSGKRQKRICYVPS